MQVMSVLFALALATSSAQDKDGRFRITTQQVVNAGNGIYRLAVEGNPAAGNCGAWSAATGPLHPVGNGVNVIFGGATNPGTSTTVLRSYSTNQDYGTTTRYPQPLCTAGSTTLTPIVNGTATVGHRMTWIFPDGPNGPRIEFIQEVVVEGPVDGTETVDNTVIRETHTVRNLGPGNISFGLRKLWDWQIDQHDGPYFGDCARPNRACNLPMNMTAGTAPQFPATYVINVAPAETACPSPVGPAGPNCSGQPLYLVAGTVSPPSSLTPPPTTPELLQFNSWGTLVNVPWEPPLTGGTDCNVGSGDTAVAYFYGRTQATAIQLTSGQERSFTQYVAAAAEGCPRVVTPPPTSSDPCCPPWNASLLEEMLFYEGSGGIAAPYTLKFKPTPNFITLMQAYIDYVHLANPAVPAITIHFRINDAGTGNAPAGGPQVGGDYYATWSFNGSGPVPPPAFFNLGPESLQINRWYRIHTGIYLEGGQTFFPASCNDNDVDVRIQVQRHPLLGPGTRVLQFRTRDGRIFEGALPRSR